MDDHVATALGVITEKKTEHYPQALPLCIIFINFFLNNIVRHITIMNESNFIEDTEPTEKKPLLDNQFPI